jgi:uncharacterized protein YbjT (DUF2867 family)
MKKALILGASGLVGSHLLELLLADARYSKVVSLVRKASDTKHPKQHHFEGVQDLFICIGTTQKKTPDRDAYYAIDYDIPTLAASIAVQKGMHTCVVVSAMGADAHSRIFYNATKGKMEDTLQNLHIPHLVIVRPSLIAGARKERRWGEQTAKVLFRLFSFLIPKKYQAIEAHDIAKAMLILAQGSSQKTIWENDELLHEVANATKEGFRMA